MGAHFIGKSKRGLVPAVRIGIGMVLGLYAFWLLAANIALSSGLVSWAASSDRRTVSYASAWTLWPAVVHVRDFEFRMDGRKFQLSVAAREAELDIELWALFGKRFKAGDIEAEQLAVRYRKKQTPSPEARERMKKFPPIDGLPPPLEGAEPPKKTGGSPWTIDLDVVRAEVDEVWVDEFRTEGLITMSGGYWHRLGEALELETVALELHELAVHVGDAALASGLEGLLVAELPRVATKEVLDALTFVLRAHGRVVDLNALTLPKDLSLRDGDGLLELDVEVAGGQIMPGSRAGYDTSNIALAYRDYVVSSRAHVEVTVAADEPPRAVVRLRHGRGRHDGSGALEFDEITARAQAQGPQISKPSLASAHLAVDGLKVPDLAKLNALIPGQKMELRGGSARLKLRASVDERKTIETDLALQLSRADLQTKKIGAKVTGAITVEGSFATGAKRLRVKDVEYDLKDIELRTKMGTGKPFTLEGRVAPLQWQKQEGLELAARSKIGSMRPLFLHIPSLKEWLPRRLGIRDDDVVTVEFELARSPDRTLELKLDRATINAPTDDAVEITGIYRKVGKRFRGAFLATEPVEIGVAVAPSDHETEVGADHQWLERMFSWVAAVDQQPRR